MFNSSSLINIICVKDNFILLFCFYCCVLLWYLFVVRFVVGDGVVVFCCDLCLCFLLRANLDLFIYNSWGWVW